MAKITTSQWMRTYHRYLGFFLTGIMAVYAISGIILIFRNTDFLKKEYTTQKNIGQYIAANQLGKVLKNKRLKVEKEEGDVYYFKNGTYNKTSGEVIITQKRLPYVLDKMTHLHKAKSGERFYYLNIFFGMALLFFVVSAFWMYLPSTSIFRKGMYFTIIGILFTLILLFV